jgi:hypothetical protein
MVTFFLLLVALFLRCLEVNGGPDVIISLTMDDLLKNSMKYPKYLVQVQQGIFNALLNESAIIKFCLYNTTGPLLLDSEMTVLEDMLDLGIRVAFPDVDGCVPQGSAIAYIAHFSKSKPCILQLCSSLDSDTSCTDISDVCVDSATNNNFLSPISISDQSKTVDHSPFHLDGACRLWWPLNNTEIFLMAYPRVKSIDPLLSPLEDDQLLLSCPYLPQSLDIIQIKITERFSLVANGNRAEVERIQSFTLDRTVFDSRNSMLQLRFQVRVIRSSPLLNFKFNTIKGIFFNS